MNEATIKALFEFYKDDKEMLDFIVNALMTFEDYHRTIYEMETKMKAYSANLLGSEEYKYMVSSSDNMRTAAHNSVIASVNLLNRFAAKANLALVYDGTVSEERPYRRTVANAVFDYMQKIINERR